MINKQLLTKTQGVTDRTAIGISLMCAIHCLALPLVFALLPAVAALNLGSEAFHTWLVAAVLPTSIFALTLGCRQHKRYELLALGSIGLTLLVTAVVLGEETIGEMGEKVLTVIGTGLVAIGHIWNVRLCQTKTACPCPDNQPPMAGTDC
ncbi:MerC domain-containing protein [Microbulbifer sp. 2205BS26-8]|uniref:MerC domain-containing protein n=1 Tax=Microbulbifer sp. 2205BS26-8 TaxID=3064386 RepID=UPI00273F58C8|nr:MerC domain-containing protein [Microbulbifer sp. 2205BS26-8]MDP5208505.1 MerC domain-containing protein [Microbulbifer sp. 2205BS26-8]